MRLRPYQAPRRQPKINDMLYPPGSRQPGNVWVGGFIMNVPETSSSVPTTPTPTPSITPTQTITPTNTNTPTNTGTPTQTPTNTGTPTQTPTNTGTPTQTPTNTGTPTPTPTNPFDADASAFFNRVTAAGGTLTNTEKTAVNTLVVSLKANSIWNSMLAIYPMVGASAPACAQNLKSSSYTGTFSAGWTFSSTGVLPNGTSAYMDTSFAPSTWSTSSQHMTFYSRTNLNGDYDMGAYDSGSAAETALLARFSNTAYLSLSAGFATAANTDGTGYYVGSRTSTTLAKYFRNNSLLVSNGATTISPTTATITISASNRPTGALGFGNKECAFSSIGTGLDDTQASNLYTAVQAFNTTLSRQV
jgi:hypothetical protein